MVQCYDLTGASVPTRLCITQFEIWERDDFTHRSLTPDSLPVLRNLLCSTCGDTVNGGRQALTKMSMILGCMMKL